MDSWLIILIIIFSVVMVLVNSYLMIIYIHPDDKGVGNSVYYKILVVLGMSVCFGLILMMPLDVSNARHNGGLNMKDFWLAMYVIVFIMIVFLLPFGIFLYESDPDRNIAARICGALLYECIVVIVSLALLFISFAFCNTAHIPITTINKDIT
jgi:LMBR1 domain-containing protein 1